MDNQRILNDIKTRLLATGKSLHTFETYESPIKAFCLYFKEYHHPVHIPTKGIIEFLATIKKPSMARTAFYALKYLYKHIEKQPHKFDDLEPTRVKSKPRIPLDKDFIVGKIETIKDRRDKTILGTLFYTGIRREECATLKISDIDWANDVIHVLGKGKKHRLVPMTATLREILTDYIIYYRPTLWLFPGEKAGNYICPDTILKKVQHYFGVSTHIVRYSFGNALRKAGADLLAIRDLYGHASLRTTEGYLKNDIEHLKLVCSSLDKKAA